jgi:Kelch motif
MRYTPLLSTCLALAVLGCDSKDSPTEPASDGLLVPAPAELAAAARNSWTAVSPPPFGSSLFNFALGVAPNRNGNSVVYTIGGTDDEGLSGARVHAYNPTTDVWSGRNSSVDAFSHNGVGKIGSRLYYSGGYTFGVGFKAPLSALYAYDYTQDRVIQRASLPIFSAEGVTGVIDGKLYVLPGACAGDLWPNPGYCEQEPTRRFYRYDPGSNSWRQRASSPHFHRRGAAAVLDGKLYVVAGVKGIGANEIVTTLDVYNPGTNSWRSLARIPTGGHASGAALGGHFFVVVSGTPVRAYAYNPATNKWTAKAAPEFFGPVVKVVVDGQSRLFTVGGGRAALYTP